MHHARGELADGREFLRLREPLLRLFPVGHVLANGDDVRDGRVAKPHRNLRDAIRAQLAGGERLHLVFLDAPGRADIVELAPQHLRRLPVEDLKDRPADRFLTRDALHAGFTLAIPRLNAVLPIDDIETERQRVDDLLGEDALAVDLDRAGLDFNLELAAFLRVRELGREKIGDGGHEHPLVSAQRPRHAYRERAGASGTRPDRRHHQAVDFLRRRCQRRFDLLRRHRVFATAPGPSQAFEPVQPDRTLPRFYHRAQRLERLHDALLQHLAGGELRDDRREGRKDLARIRWGEGRIQ